MAQLHEDKIGKIKSLPMNENRLLSISMACCQATGGDLSGGVELGGKSGLVNAHPSFAFCLLGISAASQPT